MELLLWSLDRWSESAKHCQWGCVLPGFTDETVSRHPAVAPLQGVPECGLHPPVLPSSRPPSRSALIFSVRRLPLQYCARQPERGGDASWHESRQQASRGGGSLGSMLSDCTLLSIVLSLPHILSRRHAHTHSHTYTHGARRSLRPPVVALATLRQIQTFLLKAEPKPTTVVCCWILRGAFRSCQFVQVRIKKTVWPT